MCLSFFLQPSFLHTDFNRWRDEDDSEEEDTAIDDNFEAVSKVYLPSVTPKAWLSRLRIENLDLTPTHACVTICHAW